MPRPVTGTAANAGSLDGWCDGTNERVCDPEGRWRRWHTGRPVDQYEEYRSAYASSFTDASRRQRRFRFLRQGGVS